MARTPKPWWRKDRKSWFVTIVGERYNLGPDKGAAFKLFHELMAQSATERKRTSDSVVTVLDRFLDWTKRNRAPRTYEWYLERLQWFIEFLTRDVPASELKPFQLQEWLDSKDCSNGHKRGCAKAVIRALNWATKMGHLDRNPLAGFEKPAAGKRETVITPDDYKLIMEHVKDVAFRDLLRVAWETGCRPQEILALEARHVDLKKARWVFSQQESKGKKRQRVVYMGEKSLPIVRRLVLRHPDGKVFRNSRGDAWKRNAINCRFVRLREPLGRKYCLYDFRHSFATRMLESGADALVVAALMGHADLSMLGRTYAHLTQNADHLREQLRKNAG